MKRLFDFGLVIPAFFVLSPLLLVIAVVIYATMGLPIFFRQIRPGLEGRPFTIYKFRTMTNEQDENRNLLPDAERLTRFGFFLRKTSIDELPELWNVLKGDMSLVGPRPLLMQYLDRYTPEQSRRHEVKPGITGWAQIHGRNSTTWEERFARDLWYINHHSFFLDCWIIVLTLVILFRGDGGVETARQLGEYMGPNKEPNKSGVVSNSNAEEGN